MTGDHTQILFVLFVLEFKKRFLDIFPTKDFHKKK